VLESHRFGPHASAYPCAASVLQKREESGGESVVVRARRCVTCAGRDAVGELAFARPQFSRKEVIQPHLPVRLPCYDFTPLTRHTFGSAPLAVRQLTSGTPNSGGVTGGVYKARERIHRAMLMRDY
jgi:hypothetical protein